MLNKKKKQATTIIPQISYYPVILIPELLQKFLAKNPVKQFPNFQKPTPPEPPQSLPQSPNGKWGYLSGTMSFGVLLTVNGIVGLSFHSLILGTTSCILIFLGVWFYTYYSQLYCQQETSRIWQEYHQQKEEYLRAYQLWERTKNAIIKTQKSQGELRQRELQYFLKDKVIKPTGKSIAQPGVSERLFFVSLSKYFPNWCCGGEVFPIKGCNYSYSTDFSLVDPITGLSIDIEIDEPYDGKTKKPHHCVDVDKDYNRNNFFLTGNWVVIRFAEEQVVKYPKRCCLEIAQVIAKLTGNYEFLEVLKDTEPLPKVKQWTYAEAEQMAKRRFRQRFLAEEGVYFATEKKRKRKK